MIRLIAAVAVGAVLAMILGGLALVRWIDRGAGQQSQTCQFARWEDQQLWPQGGGRRSRPDAEHE